MATQNPQHHPQAQPVGRRGTARAAKALNAGTQDFESFLGYAPIQQSRLIREGMKANTLNRIASELLDIPLQSLLASLRLPSSTILRKIAAGDRLSSSESDRAARTMLIHAQAADVLEDKSLASQWMLRTNVELSGERPLDMLDTQSGYDRVRDILLRLEHGVGV